MLKSEYSVYNILPLYLVCYGKKLHLLKKGFFTNSEVMLSSVDSRKSCAKKTTDISTCGFTLWDKMSGHFKGVSFNGLVVRALDCGAEGPGIEI